MSIAVVDTRAAAFAAALGTYGERPALLTRSGASVSYADLDLKVAASREALERLTPASGRHLIHLKPAPSLDFVVAWLAALSGGHTVLLAPDDRAATEARAARLRATVVQCCAQTADAVRAALRGEG